VVTTCTAAELAKGVNLAPQILLQKVGQPSDANLVLAQVLAVKAAVEKKNKYHHDSIFRGVVLAGVPDFLKLSAQEVEQKKEAAFEERMAKMPELDAEVRKALEMKAHDVEVVPAS
jgi:hypothetical protein